MTSLILSLANCMEFYCIPCSKILLVKENFISFIFVWDTYKLTFFDIILMYTNKIKFAFHILQKIYLSETMCFDKVG